MSKPPSNNKRVRFDPSIRQHISDRLLDVQANIHEGLKGLSCLLDAYRDLQEMQRLMYAKDATT